jgi:hypothetical protein
MAASTQKSYWSCPETDDSNSKLQKYFFNTTFNIILQPKQSFEAVLSAE